MKSFPFTKMQSLGNDFVVIETLTQGIDLNSSLIQKIADRHFGIGCDQILILGESAGNADFNYRIFNADGSEAQHCGNGARCLAQFIRDNQFSDQNIMTFQLPGHVITAEFVNKDTLKISMGEPQFGKPFQEKDLMIHPVFLGNPHAVIFAEKPCDDLETLGIFLSQHSQFPEGVNVSWAQVRDPQHIDLQVYERGAGLTLACGSAACATAACALHQKIAQGKITVKMPGGECFVEWPEPSSLYLSGPAITVFTGIWHG